MNYAERQKIIEKLFVKVEAELTLEEIERKYGSIRVDRELWKKFRIHCLQINRNIGDLLVELLEKHVGRYREVLE